MKNKKNDELKSKLIKDKKNTMKTLSFFNKSIDYRNEFSTELSYYDNHPADIGTELFMMSQDINLKDNEENILNKIDHALEKIETDKYGVCEDCKQKIDIKRLEILPYASKCIKCEEEDSYLFAQEELNRDYNFGKAFKDSFQSVNDYNIVDKDPSFSTGDYIGLANTDEIGIVEDVEKISNEYYKKQL